MRRPGGTRLAAKRWRYEEDGPVEKRSRACSSGTSSSAKTPAKEYNPLDEPPPLGLKLTKSPSFLELIQKRLSQSGDPKAQTQSAGAVGSGLIKESESKGASAVGPGSSEKMKASNFPAWLLKIGKWEYKARYEGDLVAKCYFAKQKLVYEVLEQRLKSKIEIQWCDIMGLKANCPEQGPETLTLVLAKPPLFFREINPPQPRKHTLWQASSDFTHGQATMNRQHFLQCSQGVMNKHLEKLVQCDPRLFHLSRQPELVMDSPYFDARPSIFGTQNLASPVGAQSSSQHMMYLSHDAPSPSSDDAQVVNSANCGQMELDGLHKSMSLSDFVGLLSTDSSQQVNEVAGLHQSMSLSDFLGLLSTDSSQQVDDVSGLHQSMSLTDFLGLLSTDSSQQVDKVAGLHQSMSVSDDFLGLLSDSTHVEKLENMKQQLLSDDMQFDTPDEKSLMPRVNSLFNLLYNTQLNTETSAGEPSDLNLDPASSSKPQGMFRKDSFSDLLLHLPRVTSLPKFLSFISEEDGDAFNNL